MTKRHPVGGRSRPAWRSVFRLTSTAAALVGALALAEAAAAACACGPDFCQDDARIPAALKSKKDRLAASGFAPALVALLDKADRCVAAIERAPDTFTLMTVKPNGDTLAIEISDDNERIAREQVLDGRLSAYYKFNVREAFACCQRPPAAQRPDWSAALSLSLGQAIACRKASAAVECK